MGQNLFAAVGSARLPTAERLLGDRSWRSVRDGYDGCDHVSRAVWGGWAAVAAFVTALLASLGDSPWSVLGYAAVWLVSTIGPGILLWRLLNAQTTLAQEWGFGPVLGVTFLLPVWALATALDRSWLMWLWPVVVAAVFLAVPALREHWRPRRAAHLHTSAAWHVAMMLATAGSVTVFYERSLHALKLPPQSAYTFQDHWYELSVVEALGRSVFINDPAVAGVPLHYHWFAHAHVAATKELSGLPAPDVLFHLWPVATLMVLVFALAAATDRILRGPDGRGHPHALWWAGPLVVFLTCIVPVVLVLSSPKIPEIDNGFVASSTSGQLALVIVLAAVGPVLDLLQGQGANSGKTWFALAALLVLSSGTKPSLLPVFACGGLMVLAVQWIRQRRIPVVPFLLTVVPLLLILPASWAVIGSTGGSRLQLLQTLALDTAFQDAARVSGERAGHGGWLAPGLVDGSVNVWSVALVVLMLFVATELPRLIGLFGAGTAEIRRDYGYWWVFGVVGSGFAGLWVLSHPAYSQHYFWRIVIPLGMVLTITTAIRQLPTPARRAVRPVMGFVLAGLLTSVALRPIGTFPDGSVAGRLVPYGLAALILAGCLVLYRRKHGSGPQRDCADVSPPPRGTRAYVLIVCFVCSLGLGQAAVGLVPRTQALLTGETLTRTPSARLVTPDEQRAAMWLKENSEPDDVVATNVVCSPPEYVPDCRHVSFWVAGLTGRQLYLGGWAYTAASLTAWGQDEGSDFRSYQRVSTPWPQRLELSLRAVRDPSDASLDALRVDGVRWIFADRRATEVSARLSELATLRYRNADVDVYDLHALPAQTEAPAGP